MPNFTIDPVTGSGRMTITVTPSGYNTDGEDRVSTLTLSNSINTKQVALRQKYQPIMNQFGSTNFPASGGNIYFTVRTEYDIVFRSVPSWIRIFNDSTGVEYSEGERISFTGLTANTTFRLTAEPNPTQSSRSISSTFNMGHYIGNALQNRVSYFSFTQEGSYIPPTPTAYTTAVTTEINVEGLSTYFGSFGCYIQLVSEDDYSHSTGFTFYNDGSQYTTLTLKYRDLNTRVKLVLGSDRYVTVSVRYGTQTAQTAIQEGGTTDIDFWYEDFADLEIDFLVQGT